MINRAYFSRASQIPLVACILVGLVACGHLERGISSKVQQNTGSPLRQQATTTIESAIRDDDSLFGKWSEQSLRKPESLTAVQFVDRENGWIASHEGSVYHTSNGGVSWNSLSVPVPKGAYISSLFFVNATVGWIACGLTSPDVLEFNQNKAWVFHTNDGGQNWRLQYQSTAVQIAKLRFANEQDGWAIGAQFVMRDTLQTIPFLIRTADQGKQWVDLSQNLQSIGPGDSPTDVYSGNPSEATLVTSRGKLFRTADGGQNWQQIADIEKEPEQTFIGRLVESPPKTFWMVGGADSIEGVWGILARRDLDGTSTNFRTNCYLSDVLFISNESMFAAGHLTDVSLSSPIARREGIILHSSDGGKTWLIVYRGSVSGINALAFSGSDRIWAVGERGLVTNLEYPKK